MSKKKQGAENALKDIKTNLTQTQNIQTATEQLNTESPPKLEWRINSQLKSALKTIIDGETVEVPKQETKPLISIVTIFNDENAKKYLELYLQALPKIPLDKDGNALVEVVLCKTIRDDKVENNGTFEKSEAAIMDGKTIRHAEYIYKGDFNFADARNAAKYWARGEWVLSLDTDESLIQQQFQNLVDYIAGMPKFVGGVKFTVLSHIPITANGMIEFHREHLGAVRMFRNDKNILWQSRIHETPSFSIQDNGYMINDSTITIFHTGYEVPIVNLIEKLERNLKGIEIEFATTTHKAVKEHNRKYMISTVLEIERLRSQQ